MPEYETTERKHGLTDVPDHELLLSNINDVVGECQQEHGGNVQLDDAYVFGSYARGIARKGVSDLDILAVLSNPDGDELQPKFDSLRTLITFCLNDHEDTITAGFEEWFSGADATSTIPVNEWIELERVTKETRNARGGGPMRVYSLVGQEFITRDEIEAQL